MEGAPHPDPRGGHLVHGHIEGRATGLVAWDRCLGWLLACLDVFLLACTLLTLLGGYQSVQQSGTGRVIVINNLLILLGMCATVMLAVLRGGKLHASSASCLPALTYLGVQPPCRMPLVPLRPRCRPTGCQLIKVWCCFPG